MISNVIEKSEEGYGEVRQDAEEKEKEWEDKRELQHTLTTGRRKVRKVTKIKEREKTYGGTCWISEEKDKNKEGGEWFV